MYYLMTLYSNDTVVVDYGDFTKNTIYLNSSKFN